MFTLCFRGFSLCPVRLDRVSSVILGVCNATQRGENKRKTSFLNYESPALTAELEARRAGTREHRIFNVQRPIFTAERGGAQFTTNRIVDYLDARQRYGAFLNEGVELVQVDRFYQVMLETCLAAFADILFHPETGESNSERRF